ncbi:MAG TPA: DNA repair protein RecN [Planctomycetota bacterium]|nr:DNA repair protein RecN [Planctomycetota bacterium]
MLAELRVRRVALLDEVDVAFDDGLNVVSGETGEGKSLLLSAIQLLLGDRADKGVVRAGAPEASVEGRFLVSPETAAAVRAVAGDLHPEGEEEICLRRVVQADGRSRAYLGGHLCPIGMLRQIGDLLVDLHGQRDRQSLLRQDAQRAALDAFAGVDDDVRELGARFARRAELRAALAAARSEADAREARRESLVEDVAELEKAKLERGEAEALQDERRLIARSAELERLLDEATAGLHDDRDAVSERAGKWARRLGDFAALDPRLADAVERLSALESEAGDVARTLRRVRDAAEGGAARLARVDARLDVLRDLERRHRARGDLLVDRYESLRAELAALEAAPSPAAMEEELEALEAEIHRRAVALLAARRRAGATLAKELAASLRELKLPSATFVVDPGLDAAPAAFDDASLGSAGYGKPRFLASMNVGEAPRPLEDVASGGELARVLLSLKGALAGRHRMPTLIFDEIDAGVGARAGVAFGRRLAALATHHQVLVVTHLAQTAAYARRHLLVKKRVEHGRTVTVVRALDRGERVRELAEMLGGAGASAHAEAQAAELLAEAGR